MIPLGWHDDPSLTDYGGSEVQLGLLQASGSVFVGREGMIMLVLFLKNR